MKQGSNYYSLKVNEGSLQLTVAGKTTPAPAPAAFTEDLGVITVDETVIGSLGYDGNVQDNAVLSVGTLGTYRIEGNFGTLNASVTISSGSKAVASGTVKNGVLTFNKGNPVLLTAGDYSLALKSSDKGKTASEYSFAVNTVTVFDKGDTSDDTLASAQELGVVDEPCVLVPDGWVGFGDEIDYYQFTLDSGAKLSFTVSASDAVKFTVWQETGGKLKSLQTVTVKDKPVDTKELLLSAGDYYFSVQSTNAAKGGDADYEVVLNEKSGFFPQGDKTNDTWQMASVQEAKLPGEEITGWVGFGDAADFIKFELEGNGRIELSLDNDTARALSSKQIKLTCLDSQGKSVALAVDKNDPWTVLSKKTVNGGEYYLGVTCANVNKFDTSYCVTTGLLAG